MKAVELGATPVDYTKRDPLEMDAALDKSVQILIGLHALAPATRSRTCPTPGSWPWG